MIQPLLHRAIDLPGQRRGITVDVRLQDPGVALALRAGLGPDPVGVLAYVPMHPLLVGPVPDAFIRHRVHVLGVDVGQVDPSTERVGHLGQPQVVVVRRELRRDEVADLFDPAAMDEPVGGDLRPLDPVIAVHQHDPVRVAQELRQDPGVPAAGAEPDIVPALHQDVGLGPLVAGVPHRTEHDPVAPDHLDPRGQLRRGE